MTYRLARSLGKLFDEVNTRFPNRSKASDGWIGDAAHATRDSDHNPWVKDGDTGVVTAVDITDDVAPGVPEIADLIVATLVRNRDPRVKYIIHEGLIWRAYDKPGIPAWTPAPYSGPNAHFKHVHVSVQPEKHLYDSTEPWHLLDQEDDMPLTDQEIAKIADAVRQEKLGNDGYLGWNIADTRERLVRVENALTALAAGISPTVEAAVKEALADAVVSVDISVNQKESS